MIGISITVMLGEVQPYRWATPGAFEELSEWRVVFVCGIHLDWDSGGSVGVDDMVTFRAISR